MTCYDLFQPQFKGSTIRLCVAMGARVGAKIPVKVLVHHQFSFMLYQG